MNVASVGAHMVMPGASAYQTSKLAVCRVTEFVDAEVGAEGVRAVSVHPGGVRTRLAEGVEEIRDCEF